jgi:hypothetical protein
VDDRGGVVLLRLAGKVVAGVEDEALLPGAVLLLRDRRDQPGAAAAVDDAVGREVGVVELPVPCRLGIGRVQDRLLEEGGHSWRVPSG